MDSKTFIAILGATTAFLTAMTELFKELRKSKEVFLDLKKK
jgi:hypothetical protein